MHKIVIAPASFKGTLTAAEAARAMADGVRRAVPAAELRLLPMADGGEGTLDAMLSARAGEMRRAEVSGFDGRPLQVEYGVLQDGQEPLAVLESARVVGLTLSGAAAVPVERRSTQGLGELLRHCLDDGLRRFVIGLGGSATNDGGAGLLAALGVKFADAAGTPLAPIPSELVRLAAVDVAGLDARIAGCRIDVYADVDNPLCGARGATAMFGPQKGVPLEQVAALDAFLARYAALLEAAGGHAASTLPGAGAAGGLGFALQWLGGSHVSGAQMLLDLYGYDALLREADWVITGEGCSDAQTAHGKAPWVVAQCARAAGVPVTLISGRIDPALPELQAMFDGCHALAADSVSAQLAMQHAAELLAACAERTARQRVE